MEINRECYIITYRYKKAYQKINKIKGLEIFYSSKTQKYITAYFDSVDKDRILNELKAIRGINNVEPSKLDLAGLKIKL